MALTAAQATALKAAILATPAWNAFPNSTDGNIDLAGVLNVIAVPDYIIWRTDVKAGETGDAWVGTDIDGMSALNMQRLQLLLASSPSGVFDMSRSDRRSGFENPFGGTSTTQASRIAMRTAWKRKATAVEKALATGSGTDVSPSTPLYTGAITPTEVAQARNLP